VILIKVRESGGTGVASNSRVKSSGLRLEAVWDRQPVKMERVTTISTEL